MLQYRSAPQAPAHLQDTAPTKAAIPPSPAEYLEADFPEGKYWKRGQWVKYQKNCEERGKGYKKLGFLTDADGDEIDDARLTTITNTARSLWSSLYMWREDPKTWSLRTMYACDFFSNTMRTKFEEFRLCEGDWKVHAFATVRYPDWSEDVRKRGKLSRISLSFLKYLFFNVY